ncbi:MAG: DUF4262 domain-containing protein [Acidimicrobiales bacterium]|jgi:hypothetical protein|nr:DUF4262 domain-containing protein [Acidimicrobiales bacterium]
MCMRCDGYSWDEIDRHTDLLIRVHGFMMIHVETASPWTCTVGAFESWDQPELLMVDMDAEVQKTLVQAVADDYVVFGELREDTLAMLDVEIVVADESHLRDGLVAQWEDRYSMSAFTGDFVQIVPGASWARGGRGAPIRRLDDVA